MDSTLDDYKKLLEIARLLTPRQAELCVWLKRYADQERGSIPVPGFHEFASSNRFDIVRRAPIRAQCRDRNNNWATSAPALVGGACFC